MHAHDGSKSIPAESGPAAPNPIHVVGAIAAKELAAARSEALQPFHLGLDEAERNLRTLLPATWRKGLGRPSAGFTVADESLAFGQAQARPASPVDQVPAPAFELWAPWYVDADGDTGQPA